MAPYLVVHSSNVFNCYLQYWLNYRQVKFEHCEFCTGPFTENTVQDCLTLHSNGPSLGVVPCCSSGGRFRNR